MPAESDDFDWHAVDACQLCGDLADYVTVEQDVLCERCTRETGQEIQSWI